jgi:hypothetical protein
MQVNWKQLQTDLGNSLATELQGLVEGAASDIQAYANEISAELILALSNNDVQGVEELKAQLGVIAEMNRVRLAKAQETFTLKLIGVVISTATSALAAAAGGLTPKA